MRMQTKDVLTTGDVARICHVAPRTVSKWFDTGKLRGYRIPGSRDRRIPRGQLMAFMRAYGIPLDELTGPGCRALLVDSQATTEFIEPLCRTGRYSIELAANGFEAGVLAEQLRPHVILLEAENLDEAAAICRNIKGNVELSQVRVVAMMSNLDESRCQQAIGLGFDGVLAKPYTPEQLARAIEDATNLVT